MTKKDYELIASAIVESKSYIVPEDLANLVWILSGKLKDQNPLFDPRKFLVACGIEG